MMLIETEALNGTDYMFISRFRWNLMNSYPKTRTLENRYGILEPVCDWILLRTNLWSSWNIIWIQLSITDSMKCNYSNFNKFTKLGRPMAIDWATEMTRNWLCLITHFDCAWCLIANGIKVTQLRLNWLHV